MHLNVSEFRLQLYYRNASHTSLFPHCVIRDCESRKIEEENTHKRARNSPSCAPQKGGKTEEFTNLTHPTVELPRCRITSTLTSTTLTSHLHIVNSFRNFLSSSAAYFKGQTEGGQILISKDELC